MSEADQKVKDEGEVANKVHFIVTKFPNKQVTHLHHPCHQDTVDKKVKKRQSYHFVALLLVKVLVGIDETEK